MTALTWIGWALAALFVLLLFGIIRGFRAKLVINHTWDATKGRNVEIDDSRDGDPFVGLALSGGGGRAAVFAAEGMRVLAEHGLLQKVTHVSSVSGGGFPAAYLATQPLVEGETTEYFDRLHGILGRDFVREILIKQITHPARLFSPSRRLVSLQEVLEEGRPDPSGPDTAAPLPYLADKTFDDIKDGRRYYFNGVSYDYGRRFTLSNAPIAQPRQMPDHALPEDLLSYTFSRADEIFPELDNSTPRSTDPDMPLSLAVAISAAFPPVMGPASIHVKAGPGKDAYWHLGDGGVLENSGVEMLREAYLGQYRDNPQSTGALIYSFDAGLRLDGTVTERKDDISLWSPWKAEVTRMVDSIIEYAIAHRKAFVDAQNQSLPTKITEVHFGYLVKSGETLAPAPALLEPGALAKLDEALKGDCATKGYSTSNLLDMLTGIDTSYTITPCNAVLMKWAARVLVEDWIAKSA